ncbi:MAG: hypothetical protein EBT41_11460 [Betaproteobacteria bacterium]|nr:hypothetical protein [Betaproteobacteria bacterium]
MISEDQMTTSTRCALYARVSTQEQTPENQLMALRDLAEKNNQGCFWDFQRKGRTSIHACCCTIQEIHRALLRVD